MSVEGNYPFHSTRIIVETARPARFAVMLRVPEWAAKPAYRVDDGGFVAMSQMNGFHRVEGTGVGGRKSKLVSGGALISNGGLTTRQRSFAARW